VLKVRVFNGPNLNLPGQREPETYGHRSLEDIMHELERSAGECGLQLDHMQTNSAINSREPFRQVNDFSDIAIGAISGFRGERYLLAGRPY